MIIPRHYPDGLPPGQFAIPDLDWTVNRVPLNLTDLKPVRGIFTRVQKCRFFDVLERYYPRVKKSEQLTNADLRELENRLEQDITTVIDNWDQHPPTDPQLTQIAIGIHLWGGDAGRQVFLKPGFAMNFNLQIYRKIIGVLRLAPPQDLERLPFRRLELAVELFDTTVLEGPFNTVIERAGPLFAGLGVSFASKHLSFWSRPHEMPTPLPIYDSVMATFFMGRPAHWKDYWSFVNGMREAARTIAARPGLAGFTVLHLERQLFVWKDTDDALNWPRHPRFTRN